MIRGVCSRNDDEAIGFDDDQERDAAVLPDFSRTDGSTGDQDVFEDFDDEFDEDFEDELEDEYGFESEEVLAEVFEGEHGAGFVPDLDLVLTEAAPPREWPVMVDVLGDYLRQGRVKRKGKVNCRRRSSKG